MSLEQINGVIRALVPPLVAFGAGRGWIGAESAADVTAVFVAVAAAVWSWFSNRAPAA